MKKLIINGISLALLSLFLTIASFAQEPGAPPPPPTNPSGGSNSPVGGGAPIGSGLIILLSLGAAYGGKKMYQIRKND